MLRTVSNIVFITLFLIGSTYGENLFPVHTAADSTLRSFAGKADSTGIDTLALSDSTLADTTAEDTTAIAKTPPDTLKPVYGKNLSGLDYTTVISKEKMNRKDYRSTGSMLSYAHNGYLQDLGMFGQPMEAKIYTLGYNNISYMADGILINNRTYNSYDLNLFQGESIDSLEILPLPRGFLFGPDNNPVSINLLTRDRIAAEPYTRIRFYQAPGGEGFVDVFYNMYMGNRINGTFEVTNGTIDPWYEGSNNGYSKWNLSGKLRYMPGNLFNFVGSYNYVNSQQNLYGGVDISEIPETFTPAQRNERIYNRLLAPVNYPEINGISSRYIKTSGHRAELKLLSDPGDNFFTDLTFYYRNYTQEFRQDEYSASPVIPDIKNNNMEQQTGIRLRQELDTKYAGLKLFGYAERFSSEGGVLKESILMSRYAASGLANLNLFDEAIVTTGFAKVLYQEENVYPGFGGDGRISIGGKLGIYGGTSYFERPHSFIRQQYAMPGTGTREKISVFEAGVTYTEGYNSVKGNLFAVNNSGALVAVREILADTVKTDNAGFYRAEDLANIGVGLSFNFRYKVIGISGNGSYNITSTDNIDYKMPRFTFFGGIYYIDTLFNSNLDLKAGVNFRLYGRQNFSGYDFQQYTAYHAEYSGSTESYYFYNTKTDDAFGIDLFVSGIIREKAIVYLALENVLDKDYYLVPYYPKQEMSFRFGLAWELYN